MKQQKLSQHDLQLFWGAYIEIPHWNKLENSAIYLGIIFVNSIVAQQ